MPPPNRSPALSTLLSLWRGDLPLGESFWTHAIIFGSLASLSATITAWIMIDADLPVAAALTVQLLPAPYIVATLVGVWRSASRSAGSPMLAALARMVSALWAVTMILF